ncbi:MAG: helix-turn-helix domain-containing protein [Gammaproteobacteria bacterium]|nr:helix-turn-helix domain-containing protein [Gammaproteobacteria bacterium]
MPSFNTPSTCTRCSFASFCLLTERKKNQRINVENIAIKQHRSLKRNEALFLSNNKFQNLYIIQQGALKTYRVEADGRETIRGFYFAGEMLGYEAIYTGQHLFSAISLTDTIACEIPYADFLELLHKKPLLQKQILQLMSQQLTIGSYLLLTTAKQRLAAFLIDLANRLHPLERKTEFALPMSRQDIGNYLKLTAETVSRLFSQLQKNQLIMVKQKKIYLLQPEALKQLAEG